MSRLLDAANSVNAMWVLVAVLCTIILALALTLFDRNDYIIRLEHSIGELSKELLDQQRRRVRPKGRHMTPASPLQHPSTGSRRPSG